MYNIKKYLFTYTHLYSQDESKKEKIIYVVQMEPHWIPKYSLIFPWLYLTEPLF